MNVPPSLIAAKLEADRVRFLDKRLETLALEIMEVAQNRGIHKSEWSVNQFTVTFKDWSKS